MLRRLVFPLCGMMLATAALAQSGPDAQIRQLRLQVRQSMQMARDAQQSAEAARAEAQAAEAQKAELRSSLEDIERRRHAVAASAAQLRRENTELEARVAELESALAQKADSLATTQEDLEGQTAGRQRAEATLRETDAALATCRTHNGELVGAVDDLLDAYRNKGVFEAIGEHEPLTGIGQVRLENLLETYRDKAAEATEPVAEGS